MSECQKVRALYLKPSLLDILRKDATQIVLGDITLSDEEMAVIKKDYVQEHKKTILLTLREELEQFIAVTQCLIEKWEDDSVLGKQRALQLEVKEELDILKAEMRPTRIHCLEEKEQSLHIAPIMRPGGM